jgi:hypothetical protein
MAFLISHLLRLLCKTTLLIYTQITKAMSADLIHANVFWHIPVFHQGNGSRHEGVAAATADSPDARPSGQNNNGLASVCEQKPSYKPPTAECCKRGYVGALEGICQGTAIGSKFRSLVYQVCHRLFVLLPSLIVLLSIAAAYAALTCVGRRCAAPDSCGVEGALSCFIESSQLTLIVFSRPE